MSFIFNALFWSGVLILLGIGIILNAVLRTRIPFFRIFFSLLFIYIGISLLFGPSWRARHGHSLKGSERISVVGSSGNYDVVFGQSDIDLTKIELRDQIRREEANVIFGSGQIRINSQMPVRAEISSAFAEAVMPEGISISFGSYTYRSKNLDETKPYLLIKASVVFGKLELVAINPPAPAEPSQPAIFQ
jgi:hypothetical protein